jgi:transcriptional regulator with XRE-family HTH domain
MLRAVLPLGDFMKDAGLRLRAAIEAAGLKQVEAAEIMGLSKSNLGNWLRGEAPIKGYELYRLCRVTGITADYVLLDDPSGLPARIAERLRQPEREPARAD